MNDWQGISEFVAVAERHSFTAAARQLDCSVAQVSRNVAALEQRLGLKLLFRSTRSVTLTKEGELYLQHCRHLVTGLQEANQLLADFSQTPRGRLRITAPVYYGEYRIAPLLHQFLLQYPELELQLQLSNERLDLIQGSYDLAIRLGQLEDSSLIARRLTRRQLRLVAAPDYLQQYGWPESLAELSQHQCLPGTLEHWRFREAGKTISFRPRGRVQCNSGLALLDAAQRGLGLVQLPDYYVDSPLQQGSLLELLPELQPEPEGIWALYPKNRHLTARVQLLIEYLQQALPATA
ncbi:MULTISPECIES: LysR substrate-binding domain-containing protein [Alkalimonas]|uniref:LysR substrate-binding domain-containing protein n=1 Tax=Alkalimonas mucilaginosa TaxID=3057676 RepID=A0ABU7JI62_9GAMM|nr:LysR substrate-binding domain-containing protein [Alkalimonas sp. MEB004]MEE2025381.1 LysR substrate-binding domain-containing protein [Alkalimonas sp. MEB004]